MNIVEKLHSDSTPSGNAQADNALWSQPNKFARPPGIEVNGASVTIHGYQEFEISPRNIRPRPMDQPLRRKKKLAQVFFEPDFLAGKTVLDIGANGGFSHFGPAKTGPDRWFRWTWTKHTWP
jgi:hypothetical protein